MAEGTTQYYLGERLIKYVALGDRLVASNPFTIAGNDPDAQAFIDVTGISGTNATAINNLVVNLKNQNLWVDMVAIYPMIGGTTTTCKYNLKDPRDLDAAFRLSFAGTWTFDSSGAKPDGVSGTYANTFFVPATHFAGLDDAHVSYYSFTNNAASDDVEIGANDAAAAGETLLAMRFSDGNQYAFVNQIGASGGAPGNSNGYMVGVRTTAATLGYRNGSNVFSQGGGGVFTSRALYLGAQNDGSTGYRNSSRGCSFASIGHGLNAVTLSTVVNNYQTELGRNQY